MVKLEEYKEKILSFFKKFKRTRKEIDNKIGLTLLDTLKSNTFDPEVLHNLQGDCLYLPTINQNVYIGTSEDREKMIKSIKSDAHFISDMDTLMDKYILNNNYQILDMDQHEDLKEILTDNMAIICENKQTGSIALGIVYPFLGLSSLPIEEYFFIGNEIIYFYYQDNSFLSFLFSESTAAEGEEESVDNVSLIDKLLQTMEAEEISDLHIFLANEYAYEITARVTHEIESISKDKPVSISLVDTLINGLITRAQQDPFVKKPEIRGLVKHKVTTADGNRLDRTFRIHMIEQSFPPLVGTSTSIRRLMTYSELTKMTLKSMGYIKEAHDIIMDVIKYTDSGVIIVSGATNSGKSTFLYKIVELLLGLNKRVITIENPIEIPVPGLIQLDLKKTEDAIDALKVTIVKAIGYLMSHDPDVGLINEVRYADEISELINLALKGHLAATTMHSNDIKACLTTLRDATGGNVQSEGTYKLFINQKLVDTKCQVCFNNKEKKVDCRNCKGRGLKGKIALPEILYFKKELGKNDNIFDFKQLAKDGIVDYYPRMYFAKYWYDQNKLTDKEWDKARMEAGEEL